MHRDGVKAWEPVSDECVHVFHSYSDQPSGSLDTTLGDGLHFKTDQLRTLASVCEDNSQNQGVILEISCQERKQCFLSFLIIMYNMLSKFLLIFGSAVKKIVTVCLLSLF